MTAMPLQGSAARFVLLLLVALVLRFSTFGDPNLHGDEVFYHSVGIGMHDGVLPYVDVWDRKPLGLFLVYWLIAAISEAPLAYQFAAALCAAGTAWCISRLAELCARQAGEADLGGLLAGLVYLLWLAPLQGFGGQSPVFYNLFIAAAALLAFRALPALREGHVPRTVPLAMLIAGIGITIKTTAFFEAAFLGLACAAALWRSGTPAARVLGRAVLWAAIGAAPALAVAGFYSASGHWAEYWHAMFASNVSKPPHWPTSLRRLEVMAIALAPVFVLAALGLTRLEAGLRRFVLGWLAAALLGLAVVPNFYLHYGLPLLVPMCIAASGVLARQPLGVGAAAALAVFSLSIAPVFQPGHAKRSREAIAALTAAVRGHIGEGPLLLYDAPPQLYRLTGQPYVTPLVFPTHLSHLIEKDVSHLSTLGETRRVLALRPGAVVMAVPPRNGPVNEETHRLVLAYARLHCRLVGVVQTPEWQRTDMIAVWGDCGERQGAARPDG